jgi:hypothetical protein
VANEQNAEYELGRDVTESASSKSRSTSVVLSLRVTTDELAEVEAVSRATGRSISQVVREAVQNFLYHERRGKFTVTISTMAMTTSIGGPWEISRAGSATNEFVRAS